MPRLAPALFLPAVLVLLASTAAFAQTPRDRVTFGGDAVVPAGETVNDVVTMGGDAVVAGTVTGDVVTMGGDVDLEPSAVIHGEVLTMGGDISIADGAVMHGDAVSLPPSPPSIPFVPHVADGFGLGSWVHQALTGLVSYALLFVLGLLLMGMARERYDALQVAIVRYPLRALGAGVLGFIGAIVGIVVLAITILGIPAAVLLAIALPFAIYTGMAAFAAVLGTALPVERLRGQPVMQLGAGVLALYIASLVPFVGGLATAAAAVVGLGALVLTRFGTVADLERRMPTEVGPYRTSAA